MGDSQYITGFFSKPLIDQSDCRISMHYSLIGDNAIKSIFKNFALVAFSLVQEKWICNCDLKTWLDCSFQTSSKTDSTVNYMSKTTVY